MSIINKLFGRTSPLKETLFEDIASVLEGTKRKSFAIEYTLDTNARTVIVFNRDRHVALIYNSDKPLNIEDRLMWASESIHPETIEKARSISRDVDTNRYMSFVHKFGHTGDFIDYINVIYRDYSLQSLIDLQKVFPDNVVKRNIVDLNSVDIDKFDFLALPVDKLEKVLERRRARYIGTLKSYGVPESELSHYIFYSSDNMDNYEDIEKIIKYATGEKMSFDELFEQSNGFLWWDIVETALIFVDRNLIEIADNRTRQFVELFDVQAQLEEKQHYTEYNVDHKTLEANFAEMLQEVNDAAEHMDGDYEEEQDDESPEEIVEQTFNALQNTNDIETVDSDLIEDDETAVELQDSDDEEEYFADDSGYKEHIMEVDEYDEDSEYDFVSYEETEESNIVLEDFQEIDFQDEDEDEMIHQELDSEYGIESEEDESVFKQDRGQTIMDEQETALDKEALYESAFNAFLSLEDKWYDEKFNEESEITIDEDFEFTVQTDDDSFGYIEIDEEEDAYDDLDASDEDDVIIEHEDRNTLEHESERIIRLPDLNSLFEEEEVSRVSTVKSEEDSDFVNTVVSPENTLKMLGFESNDFGNKFKDLIKEKRNAEERLAAIPGMIQECYQESEKIERLLESTEEKIEEIQEDVSKKKALMEAAIEEYNKSNEQLDTYSARGVEYRQKIKRIFENIESYETEEKFYQSVKDSATELIGRAVNETPETVSSFSEILDSINTRRTKENREGLVELNDITEQVLEADPIEVYENEGGGVLEEDLIAQENENKQ